MSQVESGKPQSYALFETLRTPAHVSSLAFGHTNQLFVGSDDGSLRVYDLATFKVKKAVRGLGSEISSIICVKRAGSELRDAWIASGKQVFRFQMDSPKMIQSPEDAVTTIELGSNEEDTLNELSLNSDKDHLAFTMDSGFVGVIDLSNNEITKMQDKHTSVCGCVKFIPGRPHELVSGGYDNTLLHFDYRQGTHTAKHVMQPFIAAGEMTLAPPFVMSMVMSSTGVLAVGTADGRLFLGFGGEKTPSKKKPKKWDGFKADEVLFLKVAEGPIVALAFVEPRTVITCTLMGVMTQYYIDYDEKAGSVTLKQLWQKESMGIEKVNAIVVDDKRLIVGGFAKNGKGVIEIWKQEEPKAVEGADPTGPLAE